MRRIEAFAAATIVMVLVGIAQLAPADTSSAVSTTVVAQAGEESADPSVQPQALTLYWDGNSVSNEAHNSGMHQMYAATVRTYFVGGRHAGGYYSPAPGFQQWCFDDTTSFGQLTCSGPSRMAIANCWWYAPDATVAQRLTCGYRS